MSEVRVVTVGNLNMYVKSKLESDILLRDIYVKGEISNFKGNYSSGHLYFSLKDETACVQAVMFSRSAAVLNFRPSDGMKVIVRARVSLYEKTGNYQLYCDEIHPLGAGELFLAYEQLKKKLEAEGLFEQSRKRPIPKYPMRVGVVTSGSGAARRDIENIITRRFPLTEIIIAPVPVQGDEAPAAIIKAIELFNKKRAADVLIVGRGGGSIEDLWAFNNEGVARAIAASDIPVVSAVGHETDFTIADFAADLRAPTPSAAAELCVPDMTAIKQTIKMTIDRQAHALDMQYKRCTQRLNNAAQRPCMVSMMFFVDDRRAKLAMVQKGLDDSLASILGEIKGQLAIYNAKLEAHNPIKILENGYAVALDTNDQIIRSIKDLQPKEEIKIRLWDGIALCTVKKTEECSNEL